MTDLSTFAAQYSQADTDGRVALLTSASDALGQPWDLSALEQCSAPLTDALHSSHHTLVLASLKTLPAFFRALLLHHQSNLSAAERLLKQTIKASLVLHGSLIDKMGDTKIAVKEAAKVSLLDAAICASSFASLLPASDPASVNNNSASLLDKSIREHGFASKNPRVRESALWYLVALRTSTTTNLRPNQLPPLRPYLQPLMHTLEDPDPAVRDAAKQSVIAIFSDARISDAARAELKKELSKGHVRKATAELVLRGVFGGGSTTSTGPQMDPPTGAETEQMGAQQPGPSAASGTALSSADVPPVYVASAKDLDDEFLVMEQPFAGKENEHNWQARDRSIARIRGMLKGDVVHKLPDTFIRNLRSVQGGISQAMTSLRTTLAVSAVYLVAELAQALESSMNPFFELFFGTLIRLAAATKKLLVTASEQAMTNLLSNCTCIPKMCQMLANGINERSATARNAISAQLPVLLRKHGAVERPTFESTDALDLTIKSLRKCLTDPTPSVREKGRAAYWAFQEVWTLEAEQIASNLDAQAKAQLEKARPKAAAVQASAPAPQQQQQQQQRSVSSSAAGGKPSVRQMIAARKAEAAAAAKALQESSPEERSAAIPPPPAEPAAQGSLPQEASPVKQPKSPDMPEISHGSPTTPSRSRTARSEMSPGADSVSQRRLSASTSSGASEHQTPTKRAIATARRSAAAGNGNQSVNLMAFATPAVASSSSAENQSISSRGDESVLAERMGRHHLMDTSLDSQSMDKDSGMALEAMRDQADQAEQTATRLLELAAEEQEQEEQPLTTPAPPQRQAPPTPAQPSTRPPVVAAATPAPAAKKHDGLYATFEDSPAPANKPKHSLLQNSRAVAQDSWWLEKVKYMRTSSPIPVEDETALARMMDALEASTATDRELRKLSRLSEDHSLASNGASSALAFWSKDRRGSKLVTGSLTTLQRVKNPKERESALYLLKNVVQHQHRLLMPFELQLFDVLLRLRQETDIQTTAATGAILGLYLDAQPEPMSTLADLRMALTDVVNSTNQSDVAQATKASKSFAFGLKAISRVVQQLPAEVLEDQIPLMKPLLLDALHARMPDVRLSGITVLVAAHSVLQDEQRLFAMFNTSDGLDDSHGSQGSNGGSGGGLTEQQMALATYYFYES